MDYIWTNENDNFSVDVYFTKSPTPDCPLRSIPPRAAAGMRVTE